MNVKRTDKPAPKVIDVEWEPAEGSEPAPPRTMFEQIALDAERMGRQAHGVFDEIDAAQKAAPRIFAAARSVFDRIRRDVRLGQRTPLGR